MFEIPCVAIGGITPDNAQPLIDAGADFIAVCQAVWGEDDPAEAVRRFEAVLNSPAKARQAERVNSPSGRFKSPV